MKNSYKDKWNELHKDFSKNKNNILKYDSWLDEFSNIIDNVKSEIVDLGCGVTGNNTLYLLDHKKQVVSCDFAEEALKVIENNIPNSKIMCFDMTERFPFEDNFTELVIADLSLHYFSKETTENIIKEIKRVLKPNGYLMLRVNSVNTAEYKNIVGEEIEEKFFSTKGIEKRFFDEEDIKYFFKEWEIEYINEENMNRWNDEKVIWKCVVRRKS